MRKTIMSFFTLILTTSFLHVGDVIAAEDSNIVIIGNASYYSYGKKTASGASFNKNAMTAAHRTLPFGTKVKVTNKKNGKFVVVTINDRGPHKRNRVIDLSVGAAHKIGLIKSGLTKVSIEIYGKNRKNNLENT